MERIKQVDKSLSETIRNSDLQGVATNISEIVLDSLLEDSFFKSLPIVGSVIGIGRTAITIKDQLFLKKIIAFLSGIKGVHQEKRKEMIDLINEGGKQGVKVGEKLIYILDKCDDFVDAKYIAQFFCAFLEEQMTYDEFLRGSRIIQNIHIADLEYFLSSKTSIFEREASPEEAPNEDEFPLINAGILGFGNNPISVVDQEDWKANEKYEVTGGEVVIWITSIGKKIWDILKKEEL